MESYVALVVSNVDVVWSNTDEFFKTIHIRFQLHEEMSSKWYVDGEVLQGGNHHIQIALELLLWRPLIWGIGRTRLSQHLHEDSCSNIYTERVICTLVGNVHVRCLSDRVRYFNGTHMTSRSKVAESKGKFGQLTFVQRGLVEKNSGDRRQVLEKGILHI